MTKTAAGHKGTDEQFLANVNTSWDLFYHDSGVLEVRAILKSPGRHSSAWEGWGEIISGYFDDRSAYIECVTALDRSKLVKGIYNTMNPVVSALLGRAQNRLVAAGKRSPTTSDDDIVSRKSLLIDCDPFRPAEIASTQAEMEAALTKAMEVSNWLCARGFPQLDEGQSGNGAHRVGRIDLPNDDETKQLISNFLECLNWKFGTVPTDDKEAKRQFAQGIINVGIDTTVFNASRITKLFGTAVRKGDDTRERPHRRAQLTHIVEQRQVIDRGLLELVAQEYQEYKAEQARSQQVGRKQFQNAGAPQTPDWCLTVEGVERWLREHNLTLGDRETYNKNGYTHRWAVDCLTNTAHKDGAAIFWGASKGLGYTCHHNGKWV